MVTLTTIFALALADALNPFSLAALVYLLGAPHPLRNGLLFTAGTYVAYFIGGLALLAGWQSLIALMAPLLPWWSLGAFEVVCGLALFGAGLWLWGRGRSGVKFAPPASLSVFAIVIFSVTSTVADLTSALPYFAAINVLLLDSSLSLFTRLLAICFYCAVYCAPLAAMVSSRAMFGTASEAFFSRLRGGVDWALEKLLTPSTIAGSAILFFDGVRRIVVAP